MTASLALRLHIQMNSCVQLWHLYFLLLLKISLKPEFFLFGLCLAGEKFWSIRTFSSFVKTKPI
jgi:hypothetical protein